MAGLVSGKKDGNAGICGCTDCDMFCDNSIVGYTADVSPFVQLGLVKHLNKIYTKNHPNKNSINAWVVLYELAERLMDKNDISIEEISHDEMGLSRIYNMTDVEINGYLDRLNEKEKIRVDRTAGLDMIYKTEEITSEMVVKKYYESHR